MASQSAWADDDLSKLTLSIGPNGTVVGSYTESERVIYIEALRGEKNTEDEQGLLPYALDIRILDENKIPFLIQNNGVNQDAGGDVDWASVQENPDEDVRQKAIEMLPNAIRHMRAALADETHENTAILNLSDENRWEIVAILDLMRSVTEDLPKRGFRESSSAREKTMSTSYQQYRYEVTIKRKQIVNGYTPEHSALLVNFYNNTSGKYLGQFQSCNHGTCAGSSAMSNRCSKTFTSDKSIGIVDKVCDTFTPYGVHVCHDDTRIQYLAFRNGYYGSYSECYTPMLTTPNCD